MLAAEMLLDPDAYRKSEKESESFKEWTADLDDTAPAAADEDMHRDKREERREKSESVFVNGERGRLTLMLVASLQKKQQIKYQ